MGFNRNLEALASNPLLYVYTMGHNGQGTHLLAAPFFPDRYRDLGFGHLAHNQWNEEVMHASAAIDDLSARIGDLIAVTDTGFDPADYMGKTGHHRAIKGSQIANLGPLFQVGDKIQVDCSVSLEKEGLFDLTSYSFSIHKIGFFGSKVNVANSRLTNQSKADCIILSLVPGENHYHIFATPVDDCYLLDGSEIYLNQTKLGIKNGDLAELSGDSMDKLNFIGMQEKHPYIKEFKKALYIHQTGNGQQAGYYASISTQGSVKPVDTFMLSMPELVVNYKKQCRDSPALVIVGNGFNNIRKGVEARGYNCVFLGNN